jgi:hypothetical protein
MYVSSVYNLALEHRHGAVASSPLQYQKNIRSSPAMGGGEHSNDSVTIHVRRLCYY